MNTYASGKSKVQNPIANLFKVLFLKDFNQFSEAQGAMIFRYYTNAEKILRVSLYVHLKQKEA